MAISFGGVTLHVADVERSLEWYQRIPGVEVVVHRPGQFAMLKIGGQRLGLLKHEHGQFHLEIDTDNLDGMYEQLREVGIAKAPPSNKPWGERDMLVIDPDDYMVEFGGE